MPDRSRHVYSNDLAVRRDEPRKLQRGFTAAAADVQDVLTRARRKCRQRATAQWREL